VWGERSGLVGGSVGEVSSRRQRAGQVVLTVLLVGCLAFVLLPRIQLSSDSGLPPTDPAPAQPQRSTDTITIRWRARDLTPAAKADTICVIAGRYGRVCADFGVGMRPAVVLTAELARRGVQVNAR